MRTVILYCFGALLIGASASLAGYGFMQSSLPDQALAFPVLIAGAVLVRTTWCVEHAPHH